MKRKLLAAMILASVCLAPVARASSDDEEPVKVDARLEGYSSPVVDNKASNSSVWFLLMACGLISLGVMFVSSKRTHLD
jgi:hypothetical protein